MLPDAAISDPVSFLFFFFLEETRPQVETEGMPLPQPPEGATRNVVSRRMTGKGRDWKIVRGYCGEKKMPPFLFFLLLSFICSECVPVALATYVLDTQKSYMQVPKMFVLE